MWAVWGRRGGADCCCAREPNAKTDKKIQPQQHQKQSERAERKQQQQRKAQNANKTFHLSQKEVGQHCDCYCCCCCSCCQSTTAIVYCCIASRVPFSTMANVILYAKCGKTPSNNNEGKTMSKNNNSNIKNNSSNCCCNNCNMRQPQAAFIHLLYSFSSHSTWQATHKLWALTNLCGSFLDCRYMPHWLLKAFESISKRAQYLLYSYWKLALIKILWKLEAAKLEVDRCFSIHTMFNANVATGNSRHF